MSYYTVFGLDKEPFSTSPDPEFFYHSLSHVTALKRLEIAIRLRRGLSLVIGDVGVGKTTLLRALVQEFRDEPDFIFHMMLDASHPTEEVFLENLAKLFGLACAGASSFEAKEAIEKYLFQKGVIEGKTVVLLIDEGQKIPTANLEVLRTLLNYETNEYKLLQLVIMAQTELLPRISCVRNFMDRITFQYSIGPLNEAQTYEMIEFRLRQAGSLYPQSIFTPEALAMIFQESRGYPRQIARLCHNALEAAVMQERRVIDAAIIGGLIVHEAAV